MAYKTFAAQGQNMTRPKSVPVDGGALVAALAKAKMTQRQLAAAIGKTEATISRLASGQGRTTTDTLAKIATTLGVSVAVLAPQPVPDGSAYPEGLAAFLMRHEDELAITQRERFYLENSRFKAEPWLVFNDDFWGQILMFWRKYLKEQDKPKR